MAAGPVCITVEDFSGAKFGIQVAGADERAQKAQDSALAVYAVFPLPRFSFVPLPNSPYPQSVKYVWSVGVP